MDKMVCSTDGCGVALTPETAFVPEFGVLQKSRGARIKDVEELVPYALCYRHQFELHADYGVQCYPFTKTAEAIQREQEKRKQQHEGVKNYALRLGLQEVRAKAAAKQFRPAFAGEDSYKAPTSQQQLQLEKPSEERAAAAAVNHPTHRQLRKARGAEKRQKREALAAAATAGALQ